MSVPSGVILIWPGTNATIPSGWERETTLDDKYPKATAVSINPNVTGGSHTHTHTSPAHTHTLNSHSHSGNTSRDSLSDDAGGGGTQAARDAHIHAYNFAGVTGGSLSDAITYASVNQEPPYHEVIFVKPSGTTATVADDIACFYTQSSTPPGWTYCDGTGTTPDLTEKYLKGADTDGDSGGTGGGTSHAHSIAHTHTSVTHTHVGTTGVDSDQGDRDTEGTVRQQVNVANHTHVLTLNADTGQTGSAYSGTAGSAETVEVAYEKVGVIQNTSGAVNEPNKIIGLWLGTLADIPRNWLLCDGTLDTTDLRDKFIKIGADLTEVGDTGGSNTHTHAASNSHAHTGSSHTHATGSTPTLAATLGTGAGGGGCAKPHSHTLSSASSAGTAGWGSSTVSANSSSNEPAYRTAACLEYNRGGGSSILYNLI